MGAFFAIALANLLNPILACIALAGALLATRWLHVAALALGAAGVQLLSAGALSSPARDDVGRAAIARGDAAAFNPFDGDYLDGLEDNSELFVDTLTQREADSLKRDIIRDEIDTRTLIRAGMPATEPWQTAFRYLAAVTAAFAIAVVAYGARVLIRRRKH